jgi:hypothetical protein
MRVPWSEDRCILCLGAGPLTDEHIIPEVIGGRLVACFLCKRCNSELGRREDAFRRDPSIRIAVQNLKRELPALAASLENAQAYFAQSGSGLVQGTIKDGVFKVRGLRAPDGSPSILPTDEARKAIAGLLRKYHPGADIDEALTRFDAASDDTVVHLGGELHAIKWSHDEPRQALGARLVEDALVLKISYEFLACHVGATIYEPLLAPLREAIIRGTPAGEDYLVEGLHAKKYAPMHGLVLEASGPPTVVQLRLFGWLAFRVHLARVAYRGPRYVYTLNLTTGRPALAEIPESPTALGS